MCSGSWLHVVYVFVWVDVQIYLWCVKRPETSCSWWEEVAPSRVQRKTKDYTSGLEILYFEDVNKTFKINWLKRCLITPNSLWNHIPHSLFNQIVGLKFLLTCDYNISKIPLKLSKFNQQALLAWKICYCHNFSSHTSFIWNNGNITVSNKSLFLTNWFNRDLNHFIKMFDNSGNLLTYEKFLSTYSFPVQFNLIQLIKLFLQHFINFSKVIFVIILYLWQTQI